MLFNSLQNETMRSLLERVETIERVSVCEVTAYQFITDPKYNSVFIACINNNL